MSLPTSTYGALAKDSYDPCGFNPTSAAQFARACPKAFTPGTSGTSSPQDSLTNTAEPHDPADASP